MAGGTPLPGGAPRLYQGGRGYRAVFVAGERTIDHDTPTDALERLGRTHEDEHTDREQYEISRDEMERAREPDRTGSHLRGTNDR